MQNFAELFEGKKVRSVFDARTGEWWFSVADICAVINDIDHTAARNYWKWLKSTWKKNHPELVGVTNRIDFATSSGTSHFSDAMDICGVIRLIMAYPSPRAVPFRLSLSEILAKSPDVIEQFAEIGGRSKAGASRPLNLKAVSVRDLFDKTIDG